MAIEHPRFPTPEDERRASLLYQALRELAETDDAKCAPHINSRAEAEPRR